MRDRYAQNEADAARRFEKFKSKDPFTDIYPALLNSADIENYVAETGMICPFEPGKIKPASYEIRLLGRCIYWDENGEKYDEEIKKGQEFILKQNSIAFVTVDPTFRIPDYIALRFNLKITHVYRGLLLGTGPLVDPGFEGKLSIPLHNLTTNDYVLRGGDPLIWMEFTKVSTNKRWDKTAKIDTNREGEYVPFPPMKKITGVNDYLHKAYFGQPIRSSIPDALQESKTIAEETKNKVNRYAIAGLATIVAVVIALVSMIIGLISPARELVIDTTKYIKETTLKINLQQTIIEEMQKQLALIQGLNTSTIDPNIEKEIDEEFAKPVEEESQSEGNISQKQLSDLMPDENGTTAGGEANNDLAKDEEIKKSTTYSSNSTIKKTPI